MLTQTGTTRVFSNAMLWAFIALVKLMLPGEVFGSVAAPNQWQALGPEISASTQTNYEVKTQQVQRLNDDELIFEPESVSDDADDQRKNFCDFILLSPPAPQGVRLIFPQITSACRSNSHFFSTSGLSPPRLV